MKTIFGFLSVTMLFAAIAVSTTAAQDTPAAAPAGDVCTEPAAEEQYNKFVAVYNKPAERKNAISIGKAFLEKYGACANWKEQVDFVKPQIERIEKAERAKEKQDLFKRFDAAVNTDNTAEIYLVGKQLLAWDANDPNNINIMVPLGVAGFIEIPKKNNNFNDETLRYANQALSAIKGGAPATKEDKSGRDVYGALKYEYTKDDAISQLTYVIGYVHYFGKNDKKTGLTHFFEAVQLPGLNKDSAFIYNTIGDYYLENRTPIGSEIQKKIAELNAAKTEEDKARIADELKPKVALFNGYTERAMDAYSRAHKAANTPALKAFKDATYKKLQELYEVRFEKKDGLDTWMSTTTAKPLPNPTSEVTPVTDPEPTNTTTTGTGAANGKGVGAANGTGVGAANGGGVGDGAGTGKTAGASSTKTAGTSGKPVAVKKPRR